MMHVFSLLKRMPFSEQYFVLLLSTVIEVKSLHSKYLLLVDYQCYTL